MRTNQTTSHVGIHQLGYLALFTLLLGISILMLGCRAEDKSADSHKTGPLPLPTPPPDDTLGDTPIIISGGSIHLDFNKRMFKKCPSAAPLAPCPTPNPASNTVYFAKGVVTKAVIYDDNENGSDSPIEVAIPAGKSLKVKGKRDADLGDIIITGIEPLDLTKHIVAMQFPESDSDGMKKFRRRSPNSSRRTSRRLRIIGVSIVDNATGVETPVSGLPGGNKMTIEVQ